MIAEKEEPADRWHGGGLEEVVVLRNKQEISELRPPRQDDATKKWLLSRLRSARSGALLVVNCIDEIGKDLAADRLDIEQAAWNLNAIEETPLLYLSSLVTPEYGEAA